MIDGRTLWTVIAVVAVTAFLQRSAFLLRRWQAEPAPVVVAALGMIPPAAFAALVVPALLRPSGELDPLSPGLVAGVLAGLVAWRTRSIAATIAVGLLAVTVLQQWSWLT